ncbi:MAG: M15 family metallopeptidase [Muribaculaceae bacterium]|nr:M15 family metallopeptidase [Muribaculaceae bacterium]
MLCLSLAITAANAFTAEEYRQRFTALGLVDIQSLDSTIVVDLKYATTHNFVGENMYGNLRRAYLNKTTAKSLVAAQKALRKINPGYSIVIYDAGRPISVQRKMWKLVEGTPNSPYVARADRGGPHNYGVAVDVSLLLNGKPVDMGTPFDTFNSTAHITNEDALVKAGKITPQAKKNREILRQAMTQAGFKTYRREWWHFERMRTAYARRHCPLINF